MAKDKSDANPPRRTTANSPEPFSPPATKNLVGRLSKRPSEQLVEIPLPLFKGDLKKALSELDERDDVSRGLLSFSAGAFRWAIYFFHRAIESDPNNLGSRYGYGLAFYAARDFDKAIVVFKSLSRSRPRDAFAHYWLGKSYSSNRRKELAFEMYKKAFKLDPEILDLHNKDIKSRFIVHSLGGVDLRSTKLKWPHFIPRYNKLTLKDLLDKDDVAKEYYDVKIRPPSIPRGKIEGEVNNVNGRNGGRNNLDEALGTRASKEVDIHVPDDRLLRSWLEREAQVAPDQIEPAIRKILNVVAMYTRPKWRGRIERGGTLALLSAPQFFRTVHPDLIASDGTVFTEDVRAVDPDLMTAIEAYTGQRRRRRQDAGEAAGLQFVLERPARKARQHSPSSPEA